MADKSRGRKRVIKWWIWKKSLNFTYKTMDSMLSQEWCLGIFTISVQKHRSSKKKMNWLQETIRKRTKQKTLSCCHGNAWCTSVLKIVCSWITTQSIYGRNGNSPEKSNWYDLQGFFSLENTVDRKEDGHLHAMKERSKRKTIINSIFQEVWKIN